MAKQIPQGERDTGKIVATVRQLASEAEGFLKIANNLTDVADAATSFDNIKQAATETSSGVAEISTTAEAEDATSDSVFLTPLKALDFLTANAQTGAGNIAQRVTDLETITSQLSTLFLDAADTFTVVGNGWKDPFDDSTGINAGSSSGYTRTGGYLQPTTSGGSQITSTATVLSGPSSFSLTSAVRDGTTSQAAAACANKAYNPGVLSYVVLTFSSASPIGKIVIHGSNDQGYLSSVNAQMTVWPYGYTAAPTKTTFQTGTNFGNQIGPGTGSSDNILSFVDTANESTGRTMWNANDISTSFTHGGVILQHSHTAAATWRIAEILAYTPFTVATMDMRSISLAAAGAITQMSVKLWVELVGASVDIFAGLVCKVSTDGGTNFQTLTLTDSSTSPLPGGSTSSVWRLYSCDFTTITGMASSLTPVLRLQYTPPSSKAYPRIHEARLFWK